MTNRATRKRLGEQTVEILERGWYAAPSGTTVDLAAWQAEALEGSRLIRPDDLNRLIREARGGADAQRATATAALNTTTLAAARALVEAHGHEVVGCLNFASARNPGGGFLNGSQAQEESLARATGLYPCQQRHFEMYTINRAVRSCLYTDHMILAPAVPVLRDDDDALLETPWRVTILTAPAPNASAIQGRERRLIAPTLARRAEAALAAFAHAGCRRLVLGAWGCGVFQNDPEEVAGIFAELLAPGGAMAGIFDEVIFAVLDHSREGRFIAPFEARFGDGAAATPE